MSELHLFYCLWIRIALIGYATSRTGERMRSRSLLSYLPTQGELVVYRRGRPCFLTACTRVSFASQSLYSPVLVTKHSKRVDTELGHVLGVDTLL